MYTFPQITYYELPESDFQNLIQQEFDLPDFEIPYYEWGWVSASTASYTHTIVTPIRLEIERLARYLARPKECDDLPDWSEFLNELACRGRIPNGNYIIYMLP